MAVNQTALPPATSGLFLPRPLPTQEVPVNWGINPLGPRNVNEVMRGNPAYASEFSGGNVGAAPRSAPSVLSAPVVTAQPTSGWEARSLPQSSSANPNWVGPAVRNSSGRPVAQSAVAPAPYQNRLPSVNRALDPSFSGSFSRTQFSAGPGSRYDPYPGPSIRPVNQTPASANITPKPLSGPVAAPPAFRAPTVAPRPVSGGGVGLLGIPIGNALADAFTDWAYPDRAAFENLPPGAVGPLPGVGVAATAGASRSFGDNFSRASTLPAIPKPSWMPDWAWPYPQPPLPNELPPDALGQGPKTGEGEPGTVAAGSVAGAVYNIEAYWRGAGGGLAADNPAAPESRVNLQGTGPITQSESVDFPFGRYTKTIFIFAGGVQIYSFVAEALNNAGTTWLTFAGQVTISRVDGQDPVIGNVPPTYAPNPARRPPASSPAPRTLPPPVAVPQPGLRPTGATNPNGAPAYAPGPHPWPGSDPAYRPEPSIAPTPAAPPNFQPSELGDPAPVFDPGRDIASQPDLDNPAAEAPALQGNPGTPPAPQPFDVTLSGGTRVRRMPDGSLEVTYSDDPNVQVSGIPGINAPPVRRPQVPLIVPLPMLQPAITPRNPAQSFPPSPTTPQTPTTPNPNIDTTPPPGPPATPNPNPRALCQYERARVMDVQRKATDTQQRASNPTSGFPGLYGLQIESRIKQGQIFDIVQGTKNFLEKAWRTTRLQKVLDVLTFIGVMHNVSMLSRDVGETFMQLVGQGIQAVGIRDEEDNVIDVQEVVGNSVENFLKGILGADVYNGIREAWNKANRIVSSASAVIWTIRSISDASLDLMEWIGENTGRIGNALKRWGVVGERAYPWMSESAKAQSRFRNRFSKVTDALENTEDRLSVYMQATSGVIEVQEETQELGESWQRFRQSVEEGIPDPWADNAPILDRHTDDKAASTAPDIAPADAQKGS